MRTFRISTLGAVTLVLVASLSLTLETATRAQGPNACLAGKTRCGRVKVQRLLRCHYTAERNGAAVDPTCEQKARDKFDGGTNPAKGCFAKQEAKNDGPCVTTGDVTGIEAKVDAFVSDVVNELDPTFPAPTLNKCSAGKKKCVIKKAAALLKCYERAAKIGTDADPTCLQQARDKFDGGSDQTKGCFAKLEAKGGCLTTGDSTALENKVDAFVTDVVCELGHSAASCPGACGLASYPQCNGTCPSPNFCVAMGGPNCICRDITPSPPPPTPTPTFTPNGGCPTPSGTVTACCQLGPFCGDMGPGGPQPGDCTIQGGTVFPGVCHVDCAPGCPVPGSCGVCGPP